MITSKTNPHIKQVKQLASSAKARRESGLFVVEGDRIVSEVPVESIRYLYVSESHEKEFDLSGFPRYEVVGDEAFKAMSDTVNPQGVLAVLKQPSYKADDLIRSKPNGLYLILDDIRDPGNLGTMIRTAEAAGVNAVIMSPGCADIFNPKVIRSTMGSIFRVPFAQAELVPVIEKLKNRNVTVYGAALDGADNFKDVDYKGATAFVIGNEANGISPEVLRSVSKKIRIPMAGKVESLNAAISAAVLLFAR